MSGEWFLMFGGMVCVRGLPDHQRCRHCVRLEHGNCLGSDSGVIPEGLYAQKFLCVENIINMHHTEEVGSSDMSLFYLGVASAGILIPQLMRSIVFSAHPGSCAKIVLEFNSDCFLHSSVVSLAFHFI